MNPKLASAAAVVGSVATGLASAFPNYAAVITAAATILTFLLGLYHPQPGKAA
jgi:hypothetical protein